MGFVLIVVVVVAVVVGGQQIQYLRKMEQWDLLVMINRTLNLSNSLSPSPSLSHILTHTLFSSSYLTPFAYRHKKRASAWQS
jgi:hypothetical protein